MNAYPCGKIEPEREREHENLAKSEDTLILTKIPNFLLVFVPF